MRHRMTALRCLATAIALSLVGAMHAAPRARAVSITQLPLAGTAAGFVAPVPGGVAVGGVGGPRAFSLIAAPSSTAVSPGPAGPLAEGGVTVGPDGGTWYLSSTTVRGPEGTAHTFSTILEATAAGAVERARYPSGGYAPVAMATGADGALWIADIGEGGSIDRYEPGGTIVHYPTLGLPIGIVAGPDGALWFTQAAPCIGYGGPCVGRISTTGEISDYPLPIASEAYGITVGADGALWLAEWQSGTIGRLSTSGQLAQFPVPRPTAPARGFESVTPRNLTAGPDGAIWFTDPGDNSIGRVSSTGQVSEYPIPPLARSERLLATVPQAGPDGIAAGPGGVLWANEGTATAIARIDPSAVGQVALAPARVSRSCPQRAAARLMARRRRGRAQCARARPRRGTANG